MKTLTKLLFLFFAFLLSVVFTALNPGSVEVNLYAATIQLPLSAIVICALFVGIFLGYLSSLSKRISSRRENKKISRKLQSTEMELTKLRQVPMRDAD